MSTSVSAIRLFAIGLLALLGSTGAGAGGSEAGKPGGEQRAAEAVDLNGSAARSSGGASEPGEPCAERLVARVQQQYDGITDLQADFRQLSRSVALGGGGAAEEASRGRVILAKPGRMRWDYREPEPSLVVSDGETLWIYDPDAGEVQVLPMSGDSLSGAGLQFLFGEGRLSDSFDVRAQDCEAPRPKLALTPKQDALFEKIFLDVDPQSGIVWGTQIQDLFGNRTELTLENIETDRSPPESSFRFEPPAGTRVQRLDAP
ncbi:MAG: outer membrane lipoprotein carrier protein LolA [Myxococcales bacterium]|nr:outer membrane lipoprotein carrier protein LolA [Myxococcales bacterium]